MVKRGKAKLAMLYEHIPDLQDKIHQINFTTQLYNTDGSDYLAKVPEEVFYVFYSTVGR